MSPRRPRRLVVCELGLGHHLPPARRPVSPGPSVGVVVQTLLNPSVAGVNVHRAPGHRRR
jgi:hypothetical protein